MGRDIFHKRRLLQAPSNLTLNTSSDGASVTYPGNLFQGLTPLMVKNVFLRCSLNLPSFSLKLLPLALSLQDICRCIPIADQQNLNWSLNSAGRQGVSSTLLKTTVRWRDVSPNTPARPRRFHSFTSVDRGLAGAVLWSGRDGFANKRSSSHKQKQFLKEVALLFVDPVSGKQLGTA